jgi:hypothetical protein
MALQVVLLVASPVVLLAVHQVVSLAPVTTVLL